MAVLTVHVSAYHWFFFISSPRDKVVSNLIYLMDRLLHLYFYSWRRAANGVNRLALGI